MLHNDRSQLQKLLQSFLASALVCMFNSSLNTKNNDACFSVFRQTCELIGLDARDKSHFDKVYLEIEKSVDKIETSEWSEFMLWNVQKLKLLWDKYFPAYSVYIEEGIDEIREKIKMLDNDVYWQTLDSIYIWNWLHVVSIDIDLNCGMTSKIGFLRFIRDLISCGICAGHYEKHIDEVVKSLSTTTCYNTLLALHTFINTNKYQNHEQNYIYSNKLVNLFFYSKYKKDYLLIKTSFEQ